MAMSMSMPMSSTHMPLGRKLLWDNKNIYSMVSSRRLLTLPTIVIRYSNIVVTDNFTTDFVETCPTTLFIHDRDHIQLLFYSNQILAYDENRDTIYGVMNFLSTKYLVSVGKNYIIVHRKERTFNSFVYDIESYGLVKKFIDVKVNEITKDWFLVWNEFCIGIRKIDNTSCNMFEHRLRRNITTNPSAQFIRRCDGDCVLIYGLESGIKTFFVGRTEHASHKSPSNNTVKQVQAPEPNNPCCVCLEPIKNKVVAVPCGHMRYCFPCATKLSKCAMCRKRIERVIKVYE